MRQSLRLTLLCILLAAFVLACVPALAAGRYSLAFWREIGSHENAMNHSIFVWVWDQNGFPKPGVKVYTTWDVLLGTTDTDGRLEVPMDVANAAYDMKCVDTLGSESDVAPVMTTRRWPNWGHYSYELGFVYKPDRNTPGSFDTSLNGTLNTSTSYDNDAPHTKSLAYYSTNYTSADSDTYNLSSWVVSHGQTFVATGDRVAAVQFHGAIGENYALSWTAEILEGGPNGARVAGPKSIPVRQPILWVLPFGFSEAPVVPGQTYYLKITRSGGLNCFVTGNNYPSGSYHLNGTPMSAMDLQGFVCCMSVGSASVGTLQGTVTSGGSGAGGAVVTLSPGDYTQETQPDGSFAFTTLPPGSYTVTAWKPCHTRGVSAPQTVAAGSVTSVTVDISPLANLLTNPGFESGTAGSAVASPWVSFGDGLTVYSSLNWAIPSHSGSRYAGSVASWGAKNGGAYQRVAALTGAQYAASGYIYSDSWSGGDRQNEYPGNCRGRIGIDPAGGVNPSAAGVVWSDWNTSFNRYGPSSVKAVAASPYITVFLHYSQNTSYEWNKSAFDDICVAEDQSLQDMQITSGPTVQSITATSAQITWTTSAASDSVVEFGETAAYGQSATGAGGVTSHSVLVSGLSAGRTYHARASSGAAGYNRVYSGDVEFTTASAPTILITSGPASSGITQTGAAISWTTDVPSDSRVEYGLNTSYGQSAVSSAAVTSHALALGPLLPGQTYHYRVVSSATGFASAVSGDFTFDTLPEPGVLRNPGFESQEAYWTRYGRFDDAGDNGIQGPGWYFSFNPRSGVNYAGSAASYDAKSGGFYQRVPVVQGRFYRFCAYSQTYVAGGDAANANNRVGIDPAGGTDSGSSSIVWSPRSTSGGWQQICVCARASSSYITVYLDAQQILPLEWNINAFDDCTLTEVPGGTVAEMKAYPDSAEVAIADAVVTAAFSMANYLEDPSRASGIRVVNTALPHGAAAVVCGILGTSGGERYLAASSVVQTGFVGVPEALGMTNSHVGGEDWLYDSATGAGQRGATGGAGLNNVGLLVRTWGRVLSAGNGYLTITDGSCAGLKVDASLLSAPAGAGDFVIVTGIVRIEAAEGGYAPVIVPRSDTDQIVL